MHPDVDTVAGDGLGRYRDEPHLDEEGELRWRPAQRETRDGGVRDGDVVCVDAEAGRLHVDVDLNEREPAPATAAGAGTGRELFAAFRERVGRPDEGASVFGPARETVYA
jgi:hypothetical protein